jgi:hypothetical protein
MLIVFVPSDTGRHIPTLLGSICCSFPLMEKNQKIKSCAEDSRLGRVLINCKYDLLTKFASYNLLIISALLTFDKYRNLSLISLLGAWVYELLVLF